MAGGRNQGGGGGGGIRLVPVGARKPLPGQWLWRWRPDVWWSWGIVVSVRGNEVRRSRFEKEGSPFAPKNSQEPAELRERCTGNPLMDLGQDGVRAPESLSDRTRGTGPGRGISWKKLTQPRGPVKMLVQMENLVQMEKPV